MWVFLKGGFFSVVKHRDKPDILLVRGRNRVHFESVFPGVKIIKMLTADYPWRAEISYGKYAKVITEQIYEIEYTTFKSSVGSDESALFDAMMDVGGTMYLYGEPHRI